jgi:hypothetical protein
MELVPSVCAQWRAKNPDGTKPNTIFFFVDRLDAEGNILGQEQGGMAECP